MENISKIGTGNGEHEKEDLYYIYICEDLPFCVL